MAGNIKLYKAGNYIIVEHSDNQLTLPTTDSDRDVIIDRTVRQYNLTTQHLTARAATDDDELEVVTASGEFVIGAINHARLRNSSGSTFGGNRDAVVTTMNGSSLFGATLLESRVSANTSGRSTNASNISTLQSELDTAESNIANLQKALKFTSNDRGVFLNDGKNLTQSYMRLQPTEFKLQAGSTGNTSITTTESSPGLHKFFVQAGSSGSEASVEAVRISGSTTANTKAELRTAAGTTALFSGNLVAQGSTTMKALSFSSSGGPYTVNFQNTTIQNLSIAASAVSSGTFSTARIPNLGASKIQSGTFVDARISSSSVTQHAGDIDLADLGNVNDTAPTDGQVLTWDNANSYWKPATVSSAADTNTNIANADLTLDDDHLITLDGYNLTFRSSSSQNQELLIIEDDGTYTLGAGSGQGAPVLRIREASGYGANYVGLKAADSLSTNLEFTLPSADGSSGQVLTTNGSGVLSFATPTDTNLSNTDVTLSASRAINLNNNFFTIQDGSSVKLQYNPSTDMFTFSNGLNVNGNFQVTASSGMQSSQIKLREPAMGGSSGVILKAPSSNLASDLTFVLPDADGTSGQVLQTDGSGNLSFATISGGGASETWLADMGGLYTWSSADSGETVGLNISYGEFFYSHSTELSQTGLRNYSSSATINTTTATIDNYKLQMSGFPVHTTNKKIRCDYNFRIQSAPLNSTWGMSIWGGTLSASGTTSGERTMTLRGRSSDITANPNSSTVVHHGSFTTTSTINGGFMLPLLENRTGSLTTTTRIYGRFRFFLVD